MLSHLYAITNVLPSFTVYMGVWGIQLVEGTKVISMQLEYASEYAIKLKWS